MKSKLNRQISALLSEFGPVQVLRAIGEETKDSGDKTVPLDMEYAIENIKRLREHIKALTGKAKTYQEKYGHLVGGP